MKYIKYVISAFAVIFAFSANAQTYNTDLWKEAGELYAAKKYDDAAEKYSELLQYGESPALYFNYANSLYKSNKIGPAILNYERALRLDPSSEEIRFNLDFVNQIKTDKIEPIERFFLSEWSDSLASLLTSNQWAYLSIATFVVLLLLVLIYIFANKMWLRKAAFFTSIFLFIISAASMAYSFSVRNSVLRNPEAIVMDGSVSVKSSPDDSGTEVFVIHEGTKVSVMSTLGDWSEIRLADGNMGWLISSSVETI